MKLQGGWLQQVRMFLMKKDAKYWTPMHRNSGYKLKQIRRVILCGIKGYEKMRRIANKGGRRLHRTARESSSLRAKKKLTAKSEWFRKENQVSEDQEEKTEGCLDPWMRDGETRPGTGDRSLQTITVLFDEQTRNGRIRT